MPPRAVPPSSSDRPAVSRPARRSLAKPLLGLALALLLVEAAVRVRQWVRYGTTEDYYQLVEHEPSGLQIPEPGLEVGPIRINSLGFRGPEIEVPKPPGRLRIAFLGGSTTFCAEASSEERTWPHLVVEGLRERHPGVDFDLVNAGCAGYSTIQSLANLEHRVAPLEPDVIFVYHGTNDLTHDSRLAAAAAGRYDLDAKEESALSEVWLTWALVEKNLRYLTRRKRVQEETDPFRPDYEPLAAAFRERLSSLIEECRAVAPVVVVPTFRQRARRGQSPEELLEACGSSLYYMPFMNPEALLDGFERYNDVVREVARGEGVLLVEGEHEIPGDATHFHDSVHFTDEGCRAMADQMLAALGESAALAELLARF